jgi:uncharacterized phage protein (TIGR01671 family)
MRDIKFRAWVRDEYMSYSHTNKGLGYLEFYDDGTTVIGEDDGDQRYENIPLMQFTGLTDKNGKEIYESDFVKWSGKIYEIKWYKRLAGFVMEHNGIERPDIEFDSEVIGNIYENPDLLIKH